MPRTPLRGMTTPQSLELLGRLGPSRFALVLEHAEPEPRGKYRHWHDFRNLTPPDGLTAEQWWAGVKLQRHALMKVVGRLTDLEGVPFRYARVDGILERQHRLDQLMAGNVELVDVPWTDEVQDRYVIRNFIEEAIASSQLEGASTTRKRAKEMLRHQQKPTTKAERMILNNYRGVNRIVEVKNELLSPDLILEIHAILTAGTLDDPGAEGRFQTADDERVVVGRGQSLEPQYIPPPAEAIPDLIEALCDFANEETGDSWIHPLVRALTLHFVLGWIHPFEDGNGRAARALFYWSALRSDYWLMQYVSVSRILLDAPGQYASSFLETETDENDLTYFLIYHLDVIQRAVSEILEYAARQTQESRRIRALLMDLDLNYRQQALLTHSLMHSDARYTFYSHARSHRVVLMTARNDMVALAEIGLLVRAGKIGRANAYSLAPDIQQRIEDLANVS